MRYSTHRRLLLVVAWLAFVAGQEAAADETARVHFRPADYDVGDVHPYFRDSTCYLYFLRPGFHSTLVTSCNLLHWAPAILRHEPAAPADWFKPYFVLNVFHDQAAGLYRSYYGSKNWMVGSFSHDLHIWTAAPAEHRVRPQADLYTSQRDPFVFWNGNDKRYWCLATCRVRGAPPGCNGAVGYTTSPNLVDWQPWQHLYYPGNIGEPECPQLFQLGTHWHLLASIYDRAVGRPSYWMADTPVGPWKSIGAGCLDGKDLCAAQVAMNGNTPYLFGWIPLHAAMPGKQHWGGHLALPREIYALESGELATRLPPGLALRGPMRPNPLPSVRFPIGRWNVNQHCLDCMSSDTGVAEMPVSFSSGEVSIRLRASDRAARVGLALLGETVVTVVLERMPGRLSIGDGTARTYSDIPVAWPVDTTAELRVVLDGDIVEVFFDKRCSLAARITKPLAVRTLRLLAHDTTATFDGLRVFDILRP